jgi:hypothetical protein
VVLDDVQQAADLNGLWPPKAAGEVLVTTRLREDALSGADGSRRVIEIPIFPPHEARAYLQAQLGDRAPGEQADALATELGRLPLALAQAAAYIRNNRHLTIGGYMELLATRLLRDVVPEPGHLRDDHPRIITATWELSIDQANEARPAGFARPLMQLASVLSPVGIPRQLLSSDPAVLALLSIAPATAANPPRKVDEAMVDEAAVDEALGVLHGYSLIDYDSGSRYREVRVHELVQRATRENLVTRPGRGDTASLADLSLAAAGALAAAWPDVERDDLGQVLRANTAALKESAETALWDHPASWDGLDGGYGILFRSAQSLGESGQVTAAGEAFAALYQTMLHHPHLGAGHPETQYACFRLAYWLGRAGDTVNSADTFRELLGGYGAGHPETLAVLANLAHLLGEDGDPQAAADAFRELVDEYPLDPGRPETVMIRGNLALWLGQAGQAREAVGVLEEHVGNCVRLLGPYARRTLTARGSLAHWRGRATGDAEGTASEFKELADDCKEKLGRDDPGTLTVRSNLAGWLDEAGHPQAAVEEFRSLLADCERVLEPGHLITLSVRSNLERLLGDAGGGQAAADA